VLYAEELRDSRDAGEETAILASDRPEPFDEAALLAEARQKTGLVEFGDEGFRTPLRELLASLADARLNAVGTTVLRTSIRRSLTQRLLSEDWLARHPEIADERIEGPIVVVGMMRSGTTLIQRLLSRDPRFYCAFGWEIGEPAPRPGTSWDEPDPRITDGEARARRMREFAPELYAIHPTDALIDSQDFTPAYQYLRRMLAFLQWQKRQRGEHRERWVLKTPAHLGYLDTLFSVFPDARVIGMHRGLNYTLWKMYADEVDPTEVGRQWLERMAWSTRRSLAIRDRMPDAAERFIDVWYRDAVSDPLAQVERIYDAVGFELIPAARSAMESWLAADTRDEYPVHRYSAEQFGLSDAGIREAFAEYMARFIDPRESD
jgi:hypothetical protein